MPSGEMRAELGGWGCGGEREGAGCQGRSGLRGQP